MAFQRIRPKATSRGFVAWCADSIITLARDTFINTRLTRLGLKITTVCKTARSAIARSVQHLHIQSAGSGRGIGSGRNKEVYIVLPLGH